MRGKQRSHAADVTAEACAWIAQLESGDLTPSDIEAFREWMQRSPRHVVEVKRLAKISADLNVLTAMAQPLREAGARDGAIRRRRGRIAKGSGSRLGATALACGLLLAIVVLLLPGIRHPVGVVLATPVGAYEQRTLADGSVVMLNTNTRIQVEFDDRWRRVRLEKGEAFFQVAHDANKPFVVHAGEMSVRAVGTAFGVRLDAANVQVAVEEGRVRLAEEAHAHAADADSLLRRIKGSVARSRAVQAPAQPVLLDAGQVFTQRAQQPALRVRTVSGEEIRRKLAWRERRMDFADAPLEDVIAELVRHTALKISITDPELRQLRFGGVFPTNDPDALLEALETGYGIHAVRINAETLLLTRNAVLHK